MDQEKVACVWKEEEIEDVHSSAYDEPLDTLDMSLDTWSQRPVSESQLQPLQCVGP